MSHILVIEDDVAFRRVVATVLRRAGHEVDEAGNGRDALELCERVRPDAVVTDINMPEMDGVEVIVALRQLRPGLPVVAMSGGGLMPKELNLKNAELLGAVDVIPKPFEPAELRDIVEAVLAASPASDPPPDVTR